MKYSNSILLKVVLILLTSILTIHILTGQNSLKIGLQPQGYLIHHSKRVKPSGLVEFENWLIPILQFERYNNEIEFSYGQSFGYSRISPTWNKRSFIGFAYRRFFLKDFFKKKWNQNIQLTTKVQLSYQDWTISDGIITVTRKKEFITIFPSMGINFVLFEKLELQFSWGLRKYSSSWIPNNQLIVCYKLFS